jgi:far upstream element-binding protein
MGMMREAEMIEQQVKARQAGAAPTAAPMMQQPQQQQQPAPQNGAQAGGAAAAQADYSAEWAEYYRSIGKLQEAEAIENQIKATKVSGTDNDAQK